MANRMKERDLQERIKELRCLYAAARIAAEPGPLEPLIERITQALPPGFQYPDRVAARIRLRDRESFTENYHVTPWVLTQPLVMRDETVGEISVAYRAEPPPEPNEAFLPEESALVRGIADLILAIVSRHDTTQALRESEQRLKQIMELSPIGIGITDRQGILVYANDTLLDLIGYPRLDLVAGQISWQSIMAPSQQGIAETAIAEEEPGPTAKPIESECIRKDGKRVPVLIGIRRMYGPEDQAICYLIDLTARKGAEEKIAFQAHLLDIAGRAITACDQDGLITYYNRDAEILYGWATGEMHGHHYSEAAPPGSRPALEKMHALAFAGDRLSRDLELWQKDGRTFLASVNLRPITDQQGEVVGVVSVADDITERKKMEEAIARVEKLEAIGVLAGGIAHDFNNILTAVLGNIALARARMPHDEEMARLLAEAEKAGWRARGLTQQFVTFAEGGAPVRKTRSIRPLLQEIPELMLRGSNIALSVDAPEDIWPANFDEAQIGQVLQDMVQNAKQAMRAGGRLQIRARNAELGDNDVNGLPPGPYLKIDIADTGPGIPREVIGKIFDPYFSTKAEGTGLGLTTAYSIMKRHDGSIEVESQPGRGATFSLYLPGIVNYREASPVQAATVKAKPSVPIQSGARILLMDDEDMVRSVGSRILKGLGYEVECARDGDEALTLYRMAYASNQRFAAVILDLTVPGAMGGKDCIEQLKTLDPGVKALVSSGYGNDPVLANFAEYGFSGMIPKPYRVDEIRQTLSLVLAH